ncbi:hypothetical protein KYK30_17320 [Shinella yambaruensis]|uniref:hypothetical protein n=1 Tax=Shinella yambaruensis TaxID=415996 RepID=UPI001FD144CC|nr:hypothetical protein [Shinella yambaruensis]MCJ8028402.1 hypothetical protein [Shinella yambaruensis]MCU7981455.1 hypothetical protein [Shinella yambaruensis]
MAADDEANEREEPEQALEIERAPPFRHRPADIHGLSPAEHVLSAGSGRSDKCGAYH